MLSLIVEDDDDLRTSLSYALTEKNWQVHAVSNVHAASELMCSVDFDVIVTDVRLGAESGMEVVSIARIADCRPVIIVMTGNCDFTPDECYRMGAHGFLVKPFPVSELVAIAQSLLRYGKGAVFS